MEAGDIILVDGGQDFLSRSIKFFSRSPWSHTALGAGRYDGVRMVFEAKLLVLLTRWNGGAGRDGFKVFGWVKPEHQAIAAEVVDQLVGELNGSEYGVASLLWFVWRWAVEQLHLPHRLAVHNWFPGGRICTEAVYIAVERICERIGYPFYYEYDRNASTPLDIDRIQLKLGRAGLVAERVEETVGGNGAE